MTRLDSLSAGQPSDAGTEDQQLGILGDADPSYDPETNPIVASIVSADVPGVTYTREDLKRPDLAKVAANARKLAKSLGLGIYQSPKTGVGALFNTQVFKLEEIRAADIAGKLQQLLPPVSKFPPAGGAAPTAAPVAPQAGSPPLSRGSQTALTKSRLSKLGEDPRYPGAGLLQQAMTTMPH